MSRIAVRAMGASRQKRAIGASGPEARGPRASNLDRAMDASGRKRAIGASGLGEKQGQKSKPFY